MRSKSQRIQSPYNVIPSTHPRPGVLVLAAAMLLAVSAVCAAADITMTSSDGGGQSSFNSGDNWPGNVAPTGGNDYFTGANTLRTPPDASNHTFAGDSLTIDSGGALAFKGSGEITIGNLILDGGTINHSGVGGDDVAKLLGAINITDHSTLNIFDHSTEIRVLDVRAPMTGLGNITVSAAASDTVEISSNATFSGDISKAGPGTLLLEGDNSFGGGTFLLSNANNGAVRLAHANALGQYTTVDLGGSLAFTQIELIGGIDFAPTANTTGTIDIDASGQGLGGHALKNVSGDNTWRGDITIDGGGGATIISSDTDTLTLQGSLSNSLTLSRIWELTGDGDIIVHGVIEELNTGVLSIKKTGNGTLTLAGTNTYTDSTNVDAGTLLVTGSTDAASTVNVNNASTLGGNGTIGGAVNVTSTAFLAPGVSIDTLTVNDDVDLNGTLNIEIDEGDLNVNDLLDANAMLDITGATVNFDITGSLTQLAYIFATYDSLSGTFANENTPGGYFIDYAYQGNNVALVVIPGPAALPAGLTLLGGVMIFKRRGQ